MDQNPNYRIGYLIGTIRALSDRLSPDLVILQELDREMEPFGIRSIFKYDQDSCIKVVAHVFHGRIIPHFIGRHLDEIWVSSVFGGHGKSMTCIKNKDGKPLYFGHSILSNECLLCGSDGSDESMTWHYGVCANLDECDSFIACGKCRTFLESGDGFTWCDTESEWHKLISISHVLFD